MQDLPYGIQQVEIGDEIHPSTVVKFGDGLNRCFTEVYENGVVALMVMRDSAYNGIEPFAHLDRDKGDDFICPNDLTESEKIRFVFDNVKSVDAVISQLQDVRAQLEL